MIILYDNDTKSDIYNYNVQICFEYSVQIYLNNLDMIALQGKFMTCNLFLVIFSVPSE